MKLNHLIEIHEFLRNDPTFSNVVRELREKKPQKIISNKASFNYIISSVLELFQQPAIIISSNPEESREILDGLNFWSSNTSNLIFNERNEILLEKYNLNNKNIIERMRCLEALYSGLYQNKIPIICTSIQALTTNTLSKEKFCNLSKKLKKGQKIKLRDLVRFLSEGGYKNSVVVEAVGQFAVRGDIVDIFCLSEKNPVRIEFLYDEIENIKLFETISQISYKKITEVFLAPVQETAIFSTKIDELKNDNYSFFSEIKNNEAIRLTEELKSLSFGENEDLINFYSGFYDKDSILNYIKDEYLVIRLDNHNINIELTNLFSRRIENLNKKIAQKVVSNNFPVPYIERKEYEEFFRKHTLSLELNQRSEDKNSDKKLKFFIPQIFDFKENKIFRYSNKKNNEKIVISTDYPSRIKELIDAKNIDVLDDIKNISNDKINIVSKNAGEGFRFETKSESLLLITDKEIFGRKKKRIIKSFSNNLPSNISSEPFKANDFVVHIDHGIGKFVGTTQMGSSDREFIVINYKNDDKLYVPSDQIDRIQIYKSFQKESPVLNVLGSQKWNKTKSKVKKSIEILAVELLQIYAAREKTKGKSFQKSTEWYKILEESFEYEETIDQTKSIDEINLDLISKKPMERLLCGDVGFGKTEVALRAAFKVIENGFQVAILVPTTVLALQHYKTFRERLEPFPVEIEYVSRFVSNKKNNEIVKKLSEGKIDIIIGTHKLLQEKITFKKLGLLIIDEEHKFGVNQKELIKQKEIDIDILSLSATPIPRTLSLSLNGARDLSLINSPPENRIPVNSYISTFSEDLIRDSILREIERKGQVFFVNNEVFNIGIMAQKIQKIVPEAKISIAHGQMDKGELESVINDFMENKTNVLVCTTIIESGIDMPNVNTLFINNAHKFGLSQLYQIRGRIGRSEKSSYAYFLLPKNSRINELSEDRLNAIVNTSNFRSGYDIALRDLEIRGAGNILGKEQSGNISSIGYELYNSLLESAVSSIKKGGEGILDFFLINTVDIDIDARIPEKYIDDIKIRLNLYMRLSKTRKLKHLSDFEVEIIDRFGDLPVEMKNLILITKIKILCHDYKHINSIKGHDEKITIRFNESLSDIRHILESRLEESIEVKSKTLIFTPKNSKEVLYELEVFINKLEKIQEEIIEKFNQISNSV